MMMHIAMCSAALIPVDTVSVFTDSASDRIGPQKLLYV